MTLTGEMKSNKVGIKKNKLSPNARIPVVLESHCELYKEVLPCFLRTIKGGMKLCDENGFRFIRNRVEGTKIYWNCERKKNECKARAISNTDYSGVTFNDVLHNHSPPVWGFYRQRQGSNVPYKISQSANNSREGKFSNLKKKKRKNGIFRVRCRGSEEKGFSKTLSGSTFFCMNCFMLVSFRTVIPPKFFFMSCSLPHLQFSPNFTWIRFSLRFSVLSFSSQEFVFASFFIHSLEHTFSECLRSP